MTEQTFSVVERPNSRSVSALYQALLQTADGGHAVRIELNGRNFHGVRSNFYTFATRHGLHAHTQRDGETLIVWMEKKTDV